MPISVRQAAAINLKLTVEKHWKERSKKADLFIINQEDKETVRTNLLDAIIRSVEEPKLR